MQRSLHRSSWICAANRPILFRQTVKMFDQELCPARKCRTEFFFYTFTNIFTNKRKKGPIPIRIYDLKQKEVINIKDCARLGYVGDVEFDEKTGCITDLVVPGPGCICGFLGREKEYVIPFCDVCQIGSDIILVSFKEKDKEKPDKKC